MSEMLRLLLPLLWAGCLAQYPTPKLTVQSDVMVQEGLCVFVPCSLSYPGSYWYYDSPVYGYWFRKRAKEHSDAAVVTNNPGREVQKETKDRFHLLWDSQKYNCSLDIRDARRTDDGLYFFRVEGQRNLKHSFLENMLTVHVTALNHTPDILIPGTLETGHTSNLNCSVPWACERGTPPIFSWISAAHTSLGPRTRFSSVLTLTPRPQDHGTNLTCQVHFPAAGVTVERTIQLNITCAPQNPTTGGCREDGTGYPRTRAGVVAGAFGGAGVTALLAVSLCLIYFVVKARRKKAARTAGDMDNTYTAIGTAYLGHQKKPKLDGPADSTSSAGATPTLGVEPELHYASISFQGVNPPQKSPDSTYSEIGTQGEASIPSTGRGGLQADF